MPSELASLKVSDEPLLEVKDLRTVFYTRRGDVFPVDGVSFAIDPGETFGLVGESGCGKTVTALSIMRLISPSQGRVCSGEILFKGRDLLKLSEEAMRLVRGNRISMIFQEPMTSLNPVMNVGGQVAEVFQYHRNRTPVAAWEEAVAMMHQVGIPEAAERAREYPHQMSGGMRQRIMIAMAMACRPDLLIADEPTTALDVTIQAQILNLMEELKTGRDMSVLLITHNLGIIAETCRRVAVMYLGRILEFAGVKELFENPLHPYTQGLLASLPPSSPTDQETQGDLPTIGGVVPELEHLPLGCKFRDRCPSAGPECREGEPMLSEIKKGHWVRCFR
jgi:peptide/nickel transport system ATP-binding protein/oligopeptide transport system ATP-binding protein